MLKRVIILGLCFSLLSCGSINAQDDLQDVKASFLGAGVKFNMDKPSMKARNLENVNSEQMQKALNYKNMEGGLLSNIINNDNDSSNRSSDEGIRTKPIKDTKLICEVCKAKAVLYANENCEFCKGKPYSELCDRCIAWSILNACDECKQKIYGKTKKTNNSKSNENLSSVSNKETNESTIKKDIVKKDKSNKKKKSNAKKSDTKIKNLDEITPDEL